MLRRLLAVCVAFALWGCDDGQPPRPSGRPGELTLDGHVAQLLADNVPFEFDFDLEDVNGQSLAKKDFAGKVLIVDIWGTWCGPCRMEIPHFIALQRQFRDQGLQIVGLNAENVRDKEAAAKLVRETCQEEGVEYPCALLTRAVGNQVPDLGAFPTTLFLDRAGQVRLTSVGYHDLQFLQAIVEALLKEKPPESAAAAAAKPADSTTDDSKPADQDDR